VTGKSQLSAFQRIFGAVKRKQGNASRFSSSGSAGRESLGSAGPQPRLRSKWEGVGVAGFVVGLVVVSAGLAAPRASDPDILPLTLVDRGVLRRVKAQSDERSQKARANGLSYDVRAVGEAIRRCGAATADGKGVPDNVIGEVVMTVRMAREKGNEHGLLGLLSLQTDLFLEATHAFEKTGKPSIDLVELGGDFVAIAKQNGWLDGRSIVLDDDERAALFRMRWTELTGLRKEALFAPTLDEYRAYYALYLRQPGRPDRDRSERAFTIVRALEKRDPSYPGSFARGVLYFRLARFGEAADSFRAYLAVHPDGPWTLRAKNHLLAALAGGSGGD
jgi:hypothetical protein